MSGGTKGYTMVKIPDEVGKTMFDFGTRKIVGMNYTRYISLPKAWIVASNLEKGDRIRFLMDAENRLVLQPVEDRMPAGGEK